MVISKLLNPNSRKRTNLEERDRLKLALSDISKKHNELILTMLFLTD
jgi:hypothetical protein